jgi:hypothetical protein
LGSREQPDLVRRSTNLGTWITHLAGSIALVSALLYLLGVVVLYVQISTYYDAQDSYTAAYAVSLISRTDIAFEGVRRLVDLLSSFLLITVVTLVSLTACLVWVVLIEVIPPPRKDLFSAVRESWRFLGRHRRLWAHGFAFGTFVKYIYHLYKYFISGTTTSVDFWAVFINDLTAVVSVYLFAEYIRPLMAGSSKHPEAASINLSPLGQRRWILPLLCVVLVTGFYATSLLKAVNEAPSLPIVSVTWQKDVSSVPDQPFFLLSHSDEAWHLLDRNGNLLVISREAVVCSRAYPRRASIVKDESGICLGTPSDESGTSN